MDEISVNEALEAFFASKPGRVVAQWLVDEMLDHSLQCPLGVNGTDPHFEAFRMGAGTAYRDLLERAGYRITFERKPDERRNDERTDSDTGE